MTEWQQHRTAGVDREMSMARTSVAAMSVGAAGALFVLAAFSDASVLIRGALIAGAMGCAVITIVATRRRG